MIYKGSRYEDSTVYNDIVNDKIYLQFLDTFIPSDMEDYLYVFKSGDRLDLLADRFYNNPLLKWKILFANPQYATELNIKEGDIITIPHPEKVI